MMGNHKAPPGSHDTGYAERVEKQIPGLRDLHLMAGILLTEHVLDGGRVLVLGAGGGLELKAFAQMRPDWHFDGVDPSPEMLGQARDTLGENTSNIQLYEGYIDDAPDGPYDGAACLLTLHFLPKAERVRTLVQMAKRLKRGAPLVVMHHSFPSDGGNADKWLSRYAAFMKSRGLPLMETTQITAMKDKLPVLAPEEDEKILHDVGFEDIEMFYAAFTFKGWMCRKA